MFCSIRIRNSSSYLDKLGFRSRGTNLNIRYPNNTLLMDAFTGIKYNISKQNLTKYGFERVGEAGDYKLYQNSNALPLAMIFNRSLSFTAKTPISLKMACTRHSKSKKAMWRKRLLGK